MLKLRHAQKDVDRLTVHGGVVANMVSAYRKEHDIEEEDLFGTQKKAKTT